MPSKPDSPRGGRSWRPKVTALVPCYNAAAFLDRTLYCLSSQTWPDLEILIGDDCSTDATLDVVRAFAASHPNVRVITREKNLGWLRNSNDLMAKAEGELMFFAFHDDVVAHHGCLSHRSSSIRSSNPDMVRFQNVSNWSRSAATPASLRR